MFTSFEKDILTPKGTQRKTLFKPSRQTLFNKSLQAPSVSLTQPQISMFKKIDQQKVNRLSLNFIVDAMLPFNVVEKPSFKKLISELTAEHFPAKSQQPLIAPTRRIITPMLSSQFQLLKKNQIEKLNQIDYICLTADLWSRCRRAFLGVTAHWINKDTLERESYALSCMRMPGAHTAEVVTKALLHVMDDYKIDVLNVTRIVTDGGSNFSKAFKDAEKARKSLAENNTASTSSLGLSANDEQEYNTDSGDESSIIDNNDVICEIIDEGQDFSPVAVNSYDMGEILRIILIVPVPTDSDGEDEDLAVEQRILPPNTYCAAHRLCLNASTDIKKLSKAMQYTISADEKRSYHACAKKINGGIAKCKQIFKKQNKSTKSSDLIFTKLGKLFVLPSVTRWSSEFESLDCFLKLMSKKPREITELFDELNLKKLTPIEIKYLQENIKASTILNNLKII